MDERPLVTFVVPCYNAAGFMRHAVDSLLAAKRPCEILLINDGSSDDTSAIAHEYAQAHPQVRAIDQANSNWGGVINHGLKLARGRYFKVLDSDDCLEERQLNEVLDALSEAVAADDAPDLLITNYIYDHLPTQTKREMAYRSFLPQGHVFGWDEVGTPGIDQYLMIHATWYATDLLRASRVELPTKAAYMDSILLLHPMPYVERLLYLDVAPYQYAIGREGQSVDVKYLQRHMPEQLFATRLAIEDVDYGALFARKPRCAELMCGYMQCMMSVSTLNLFTLGTRDAIEQNRQLWSYLKARNPELYRRVSRSWVGLANRKTALGRFIAVKAFELGKKRYKLA